MSTPIAPLLVEQAAIYGASVVARRGTLRSLYYDALTNWQDAEALTPRRSAIYDGPNIRPGREPEERYLTEALTTTLGASQDSANALMLLIDSSLRRFAEKANVRWKEIGNDFNGVKLNKAIWALANHARHLHNWIADRDKPKPEQQRSMDVILKLGLDPFHDHVACVYLVNLRLPSYTEFEGGLLSTAHELVDAKGWRLWLGGSSMLLVMANLDHVSSLFALACQRSEWQRLHA